MGTLTDNIVEKDKNQSHNSADSGAKAINLQDHRPESQNQQALQLIANESEQNGGVKQLVSALSGDTMQLQGANQELEENNWGALEAQAQSALPKFSEIFDQLVQSTGAKTEKYEKLKVKMVDNPTGKKGQVRKYEKQEHSLSEVAPLKGQARADQKAEGKYGGNYSKILDVVRGTLTFSDFKGLIHALKVVNANEQKLGYQVVRCKQTYLDDKGNTGSQTLYGDIKMNLKELSTGHVCELQFTLEAFMNVKQKGHKAYKEMRDANPFGEKVLDAKQGADAKTSGHVTRAIHGSYAAYTDARIAIEKDASGLQEAVATANDIQKQVADR